ncbi:MAG: hypothetical protein IPK19_38235 [Chloroflexi bacterium]|nr:hypothetical protein [Chloroflexota bacterium]
MTVHLEAHYGEGGIDVSTYLMRIAGVGLAFMLVFLFGLWLSHSGKPYSTLLLTAHKLIALGVLVFVGVMAYQTNQSSPLSGTDWAIVGGTVVVFVATIILGGLLSIDNPMPPIVHTLHQILPFVTVVASGATLLMLLNRTVPAGA